MTTTISGQIIGAKLKEEGYLTDSTGAPIEDELRYAYEGVKWAGLDRIWKASDPRPKNMKSPTKKNEQ